VVWFWVYEIIVHLLGISGGVDRSRVVVGFYQFPNLMSVIEKRKVFDTTGTGIDIHQ